MAREIPDSGSKFSRLCLLTEPGKNFSRTLRREFPPIHFARLNNFNLFKIKHPRIARCVNKFELLRVKKFLMESASAGGTEILVKKRKICLSASRRGDFFVTFFVNKESEEKIVAKKSGNQVY